jgi:hypothetical protein
MTAFMAPPTPRNETVAAMPVVSGQSDGSSPLLQTCNTAQASGTRYWREEGGPIDREIMLRL